MNDVESLATNAEDQSPDKHEPEAVFEPTECHDALTGRDKRRLNYHHGSRSKFIDEMAANKRQDNVWQRVNGVEP